MSSTSQYGHPPAAKGAAAAAATPDAGGGPVPAIGDEGAQNLLLQQAAGSGKSRLAAGAWGQGVRRHTCTPLRQPFKHGCAHGTCNARQLAMVARSKRTLAAALFATYSLHLPEGISMRGGGLHPNNNSTCNSTHSSISVDSIRVQLMHTSCLNRPPIPLAPRPPGLAYQLLQMEAPGGGLGPRKPLFCLCLLVVDRLQLCAQLHGAVHNYFAGGWRCDGARWCEPIAACTLSHASAPYTPHTPRAHLHTLSTANPEADSAAHANAHPLPSFPPGHGRASWVIQPADAAHLGRWGVEVLLHLLPAPPAAPHDAHTGKLRSSD